MSEAVGEAEIGGNISSDFMKIAESRTDLRPAETV
jgi:hypothetical protein